MDSTTAPQPLEAVQAFMLLLALIGLPAVLHLYVSLMYILKLWDKPLPCDWHGNYRYEMAMHFKAQWWWLIGGMISLMFPHGVISEQLPTDPCEICNSTSSNDQCAHCSVEDDDDDSDDSN